MLDDICAVTLNIYISSRVLCVDFTALLNSINNTFHPFESHNIPCRILYYNNYLYINKVIHHQQENTSTATTNQIKVLLSPRTDPYLRMNFIAKARCKYDYSNPQSNPTKLNTMATYQTVILFHIPKIM